MRIRTPYRGVVCASVATLTMAATGHAATIAVPAGGDLQAALNAAQAGDVITLAPGATYVGNFVLPNKGALSDYITIRSAAPDAVLPPAGVRISPVVVSHGDVKVSVTTEREASQPTVVGGLPGEGVRSLVVTNTKLAVETPEHAVVSFPSTTVGDLVKGLAKVHIDAAGTIDIPLTSLSQRRGHNRPWPAHHPRSLLPERRHDIGSW